MLLRTSIHPKVICAIVLFCFTCHLSAFEKKNNNYYFCVGAAKTGISLTPAGIANSIDNLSLDKLENPHLSLFLGRRFNLWGIETGLMIRESDVRSDESGSFSFKEKFSKSNIHTTLYYYHPLGSYYELMAGFGLSLFESKRTTTGQPEQFPSGPKYSHLLPKSASIQPRAVIGIQSFLSPCLSMRTTLNYQMTANHYFDEFSGFSIALSYYI